MDLELTLSFIAASILLTLMPGPDNIYVLTESISRGFKNGFTISVGLVLGVLVHTFAAATGVSILLFEYDWAFNFIKYLGATYMFYLAYQSLGDKSIAINTKDIDENYNFGILVKKGFLMNVLNPKVSLFFIAFLPQFIYKEGFNITLQMLILGVLFMFQALIIFFFISKLSSTAVSYLDNPNFWKVTKYIKIIVLLILGLTLLLLP